MKEILFKKVRSFNEYVEYCSNYSEQVKNYREYESLLTKNNSDYFYVEAFCFVCKHKQKLLVDYNYSSNGPNWRERLVCCKCGLNSRLRASVHFVVEGGLSSSDLVYLAEQSTPLYRELSVMSNVTGSEYLDNIVPFGCNNDQGYRNENSTCLTFADGVFDFYLSFDVIEHVPDYARAVSEAYRVLKEGGVFIFTVPFAANSEHNIIRATVDKNGVVSHLMEPQYHGDPIRDTGVLCYYIFGWEFLKEIKGMGFIDSMCCFYLSRKYGYLGGPHMIFMAKK